VYVRFDWDPEKARENYRKHGVLFETAALVFDDPDFMMYPDRDVEGEERWHTIGRVLGVLVLLVVHTFEEEDEEEIVRIISAREVTAHEKRLYENSQQ
jgi:uncharacterized DUF497 family protein